MKNTTAEPTAEQEISLRREIVNNLIKILETDERVNFVLSVGSTAEAKENELSDVDICVVMKDDKGLNQILRELNILFSRLATLVDYYEYNPYHFYVVYQPTIPLDIYFVSSSIYFIIKNDNNKRIIDHSNRQLPGKQAERQVMIGGLFLKGLIRTFRLLSKIKKGDYVSLVYILNQIREDQLIPLLSTVNGYQIAHAKAVRLERFDDRTRELFIKTFCPPTEKDALAAVKATAEILNDLFSKASAEYDLGNLRRFAEQAYRRVMTYPGH